MRPLLENDYAQYWMEQGILCCRYRKGLTIDHSTAVAVARDRFRLQQGRPFAIFCDISGVKGIDINARNYLAGEGSMLINAVAFLVGPPLSHVISAFYIKTNRPPVPTGVFMDKREAMDFLIAIGNHMDEKT
ncbi:DUF7793 family protein [Sediminicola luteus]|nr:hypothetical protein [Sediminicola luteus]